MLPFEKLEQLQKRYVELDDLLCQQHILTDRNLLSKLNKERAEIEPIVLEFRRFREAEEQIRQNESALSDPELRELAEMELAELRPAKEAL